MAEKDGYLYQNDGKPWLTEDGNRVPSKCPTCGAPVGLFIKGEPVFLCRGKGEHYIGTLKF